MDESVKMLLVLPVVLMIGFAFFSSPLRATMFIVAFQKIIDIFWFIRPKAGSLDLSAPRILYTIIPFILLIVIVVEAQKRQMPRMPWLKNLIVFYLLWFALSVWRGPYPDSGVELFLKVLGGFVMFGAGWYYFDSEEKFDEFARIITLTAVIPFLGVALQFFGIFSLDKFGISLQTSSTYLEGEMGARYPGFYNDSGTSSLYMLTVLPLSLYLYSKKDQLHKWIYLLIAFMAITTVILGFSRGMWVMLGVLMVSWLWIHRQYGWLMAGGIAVSVWFVTGDFLVRFFSDIVILFQTGKWGSVSGKAVRWEIMGEAFGKRGLTDQLVGGGIGTSSADVSKVTGLEREGGESDIIAYKNDLGYIGWLMFLGIPLVALVMAYKSHQRVQKLRYFKDLLLKYKAFFAIGCVHLFTLQGSGSRWVSFTFPFWFMAGFILKTPSFWLIQRIVNQTSYDRSIDLNPRLNAKYN